MLSYRQRAVGRCNPTPQFCIAIILLALLSLVLVYIIPAVAQINELADALEEVQPEFGTRPPACSHLQRTAEQVEADGWDSRNEAWAECMGVGYK